MIFLFVDVSSLIWHSYIHQASKNFADLLQSGHPIVVFLHGLTQYFKYGLFFKGIYFIHISSTSGNPIASDLYAILLANQNNDFMMQSLTYFRSLKEMEVHHGGDTIRSLRIQADDIIEMVIER